MCEFYPLVSFCFWVAEEKLHFAITFNPDLSPGITSFVHVELQTFVQSIHPLINQKWSMHCWFNPISSVASLLSLHGTTHQ